MDQQDQYIRRADVSNYFPFLSKNLLNHWSYRNIGPVFTKIGRETFYKISDIEDYLRGLEEKTKAKIEQRRLRQDIAAGPISAPRRPGRPRKSSGGAK
jgi:hypothetical protein